MYISHINCYFRYIKQPMSFSKFLLLLKYIYTGFGAKYILLLLMLIAYALIGGLIFYYIEAPAEKAYVYDLQKVNLQNL